MSRTRERPVGMSVLLPVVALDSVLSERHTYTQGLLNKRGFQAECFS